MGVAFSLVFTIYSLAFMISVLNIVKIKTSQSLIKTGKYLKFANYQTQGIVNLGYPLQPRLQLL